MAVPPTWTAIVNPLAGGRRTAGIIAALRQRPDVEIAIPPTLAEAVDRAHAASAAGSGIIACGGDGTISALSHAVHRTDGVLAVLPNGTGNDFARALRIPTRDPVAALALTTAGVRTRLDLGHIVAADGTETWFTSIAAVGFDAIVNERANAQQRGSRQLRYVGAALRTLRSQTPVMMQLDFDGRGAIDHEIWLAAIANTSTYGGGMRVAPNATPCDGFFDVVTVGAVSRRTLLTQLPRVYRGTHLSHPAVTVTRTPRITIAGPAGYRCFASGDDAGPLPVTIDCVRDAIQVMLPA
jgi:diacylglycerol kinase (ATP)